MVDLDGLCPSSKKFSSFPDYGVLTEEERAIINTLIYENLPSELWPLGGDSWTNFNNYPNYHKGGVTHGGAPHNGNDISAPLDTEIYTVYYGVASVRTQRNEKDEISGGGHYVFVTSTINGREVIVSYMHMSSFAISNGTPVAPGDLIGYVGSSGNSSGPHLHFQAGGISGTAIENPYHYLPQDPKR